MKRYLPFAAALLIVLLSVPSLPQTCGIHCWTERASQKIEKIRTQTLIHSLDLKTVDMVRFQVKLKSQGAGKCELL